MTVYDASKRYRTLRNLVSDPSAENGGWTGGAIDTTQHKYGTKSIRLDPSGTQLAQISVETPIVGHVYYGRRWIKTSGQSSPVDFRCEVFAGDGPGLNWVFATNNGNFPEWTAQSSRWTVDQVNASSYIIRTFTVNGTAQVWNDGFVLIDLTECFGAGKEPDQAWCDRNIPFFEGTINLMVNFDSVTNLVSKGGFENTGWTGGVYDTSHPHSGSYCYKMTGSTSVPEVLANYSESITVDPTHLYYIRWYVYHEGAPGTTGCYFGIAEPSFIEGQPLGPANQWNMISAVNNRSSFSGALGLRLDYNNGNQNGVVWFDDFMVIDLTASFGAGNEPTKEWMDANIPDFVGDYQMDIEGDVSFTAGDVIEIPYTGQGMAIPLLKGIYDLQVWGAQGGYRSNITYGGKGGYSEGRLTADRNMTAFAFSGGSGNTGDTAGGFNGGGRRATHEGGGGGSDIRLDSDSVYARVIVAGGGGSDGSTSRGGGCGGGTDGGTNSGSGYGTNNGPGHQTYSGSSASTTADEQSTSTSSSTDIYGGFGFGGNGVYRSSGYGGAGGGGWYGGSGTYPDGSGDDDKAGCGGSGYIYTSGTVGNYPSGCLLDSSMYLEDAQTLAGNVSFTDPDGSTVTGHQGDGYCRITVIEAGYIATYMADGQVVKTETLSPGAHINPPNVSKTGYDTAWTVNGEVIDVSSYLMPESNITITAVFTPQVFSVLMYDSGITTVQQATYGSSVTLPEGTHGTGEFVGWWYNGQLVTSLVMPAQSVYLIARYDLSGSRITVDSVSLQPNPIDAGQTVLLTVSAMATDSEVPRWTDLAITADTGLPMSSPYQAQIWDTSQEDPLAVFEGDGIKTTGRDVPPLSAQTMPLPRVGIWSDAISDSGGNLDYTIHGSGSEQYTSSIVLFSSQEVSVREAKITYHSGGSSISHVATSDSDQMTFPTGTYTSFDIQITKVSKGFSHVRILNVAPGGV